jgi:hypothetical protein
MNARQYGTPEYCTRYNNYTYPIPPVYHWHFNYKLAHFGGTLAHQAVNNCGDPYAVPRDMMGAKSEYVSGPRCTPFGCSLLKGIYRTSQSASSCPDKGRSH